MLTPQDMVKQVWNRWNTTWSLDAAGPGRDGTCSKISMGHKIWRLMVKSVEYMLNPFLETSWNHGFKEPLMSFWKKSGSDMKWPFFELTFFFEFEVRFDVRFTAVFNVPGMVGQEIHKSLDSSMSWCGLEHGPIFRDLQVKINSRTPLPIFLGSTEN